MPAKAVATRKLNATTRKAAATRKRVTKTATQRVSQAVAETATDTSNAARRVARKARSARKQVGKAVAKAATKHLERRTPRRAQGQGCSRRRLTARASRRVGPSAMRAAGVDGASAGRFAAL